MRYRSIHSIDVSHLRPDAIRESLLQGAFTENVVIHVKRLHSRTLVTISFDAASDAIAKQQAASFRTESNILGPADHMGTQVRTLGGWRDI